MNIAIGELSRRTGVKVPTIRYYEQIALLDRPARTEGQQRRYSASTARRLDFIRHARELGFEISAIRTLLALQDNPAQSCDAADEVAKAHLTDVQRRIASLRALEIELTRMVEQCRHGRVTQCRVIEILSDHAKCEHVAHRAA